MKPAPTFPSLFVLLLLFPPSTVSSSKDRANKSQMGVGAELSAGLQFKSQRTGKCRPGFFIFLFFYFLFFEMNAPAS